MSSPPSGAIYIKCSPQKASCTRPLHSPWYIMQTPCDGGAIVTSDGRSMHHHAYGTLSPHDASAKNAAVASVAPDAGFTQTGFEGSWGQGSTPGAFPTGATTIGDLAEGCACPTHYTHPQQNTQTMQSHPTPIPCRHGTRRNSLSGRSTWRAEKDHGLGAFLSCNDRDNTVFTSALGVKAVAYKDCACLYPCPCTLERAYLMY